MEKKEDRTGKKTKETGGRTMKDRNGERGAGESVKVNDPRAARSWPRRGQRLMGRYIRTWMDRRRYYPARSRAERSGAERSGSGSGTASISSGASSASAREQRVGAVPLVSLP